MRIKAPKNCGNRSRESPLRGDSTKKWKFLIFLAPHSHSPGAIEVKFCTAKRTQVPVSPAKFDLNWCNESPLRGEKPDFWPVSKNNTGSLPLRGIRPVKKTNKKTNTTFSHLQPLYDLRQILHGDRARCAHDKRCHPFFDPTYQSNRSNPTGCTENFGLIYRRAVSPQ